ncbi:MAG TPA: sugar phosphate isomerase/epimerase [candidate division Zixibacteria bacterium]|jgi:sugar phosphate isomerase/epimerase|nr:sugar phosphate isomerase/epimerase family protein [Candidatus Latescibacterota bacterium]MDP7235699.1 sugar phosphate isomerase/epimerase family protein [Candidatus Latescibacterota bacterium]HIG48481.1 sugar phosphate isomerase/epimerase [candidate division Zixibacteria bacterium]
MSRPVTLFTGQWADLTLETLAKKAASWGFDGLELACWGDHFDVLQGAESQAYCDDRHALLSKYNLQLFSISNHLVGQAVCDNIDGRHQAILPPHVWGDGEPEGVRQRAAEEMKLTARAAANMGLSVVNGFTGSSIWHMLYSFPPVDPSSIDAGYADFACRWHPILDVFDEVGVKFGLEVHPTEIAFDISSAQRAIDALDGRDTFGFNYDPSHFGYQGVDYVAFIRTFRDRIYHVHMKDVWWSDKPTRAGVFGGHTNFGDTDRFWEFRSLGRGSIDFEEIIRALNEIGYNGPLSIEWEDGGMDREHGAEEACAFTNAVDFPSSDVAFDAAFSDE